VLHSSKDYDCTGDYRDSVTFASTRFVTDIVLMSLSARTFIYSFIHSFFFTLLDKRHACALYTPLATSAGRTRSTLVNADPSSPSLLAFIQEHPRRKYLTRCSGPTCSLLSYHPCVSQRMHTLSSKTPCPSNLKVLEVNPSTVFSTLSSPMVPTFPVKSHEGANSSPGAIQPG
jgi:hypothetical protein